MQTIEKIFINTTEVNRSKFMTHFVPIDMYEDLRLKLKKDHPKANHIVYALRTLNEFDQIVENSSDDREPKGCAGVPALNVLRGEDLINCAVLIVRYFGGIKLGTGGMAKAYALAVKEVLSVSKIISYEKQIEHVFKTSYSDINKTLYKLKKLEIVEYTRDFAIEEVGWKIVGSEENIKIFKENKA